MSAPGTTIRPAGPPRGSTRPGRPLRGGDGVAHHHGLAGCGDPRRGRSTADGRGRQRADARDRHHPAAGRRDADDDRDPLYECGCRRRPVPRRPAVRRGVRTAPARRAAGPRSRRPSAACRGASDAGLDGRAAVHPSALGAVLERHLRLVGCRRRLPRRGVRPVLPAHQRHQDAGDAALGDLGPPDIGRPGQRAGGPPGRDVELRQQLSRFRAGGLGDPHRRDHARRRRPPTPDGRPDRGDEPLRPDHAHAGAAWASSA